MLNVILNTSPIIIISQLCFQFNRGEIQYIIKGPSKKLKKPAEYTVKKGSGVSRPQAGCHYQTLPGRE
jgi:hypothetical protein